MTTSAITTLRGGGGGRSWQDLPLPKFRHHRQQLEVGNDYDDNDDNDDNDDDDNDHDDDDDDDDVDDDNEAPIKNWP